MADRLTAAALATRVPASSWTAGSPPAEVDRWFAVLEFDENRKALVLTASGQWAWTSTSTDGQSRLHELRPPDVVGALPALELDPGGLAGKLASAATMLEVRPQELVSALPMTDVFVAAFETRSDFWVDRALRWMEAPYWSTPPAATLQAVVEDKNVSQSIRHQVRKLLSMQANR